MSIFGYCNLLEVFMSRIMILGAGRGQVDLIKAVKKYGHTAIVASIPGSYPGFDYADEVCYVDITNPLAVEQEILARKIDGITTCCMDTGMESLGYICEKYHFPGPSLQSAKTARDKLLMKDKFIAGGVRTAKYIKITCKEDLASCCNSLSFPMIVKAVDQQGSRGINIAETSEELQSAWESTMADTIKDYCIVEEYLSGPKHGANGCIVNGELLFFVASEDITDGTSVLGHIFPFVVDDAIRQDIAQQSLAAILALGLDNCVFNVDYILHNNQVYIIEATGRLGANGIPELLSLYYNTDIYQILTDISCGNGSQLTPLSPSTTEAFCCSKMLISSRGGILKEIIDCNPPSPHISHISYFVSPGDSIRPYANARDCLGQIILRNIPTRDCESYIKDVEHHICFVMEE